MAGVAHNPGGDITLAIDLDKLIHQLNFALAEVIQIRGLLRDNGHVATLILLEGEAL